MRTREQWLNYKKLELIEEIQPTLEPHSCNKKPILSQLWASLVLWLTAQSEPRVWRSRDASGQLWWNVFDPTSDRSASLTSEQEVLAWLEKRYSCPSDYRQPEKWIWKCKLDFGL